MVRMDVPLVDIEALRLVAGKLAKLRDQLEKLARSEKIPRKQLESFLGLLMWATSTCQHLRPYLAPLYKDLRSGRGTLHQVFARDWQRFLALSRLARSQCKVSKTSAASRLRVSHNASALRTPLAASYTCAMKAGRLCFGSRPVSSMTSSPWRRDTVGVGGGDGSALRQNFSGSLSPGP